MAKTLEQSNADEIKALREAKHAHANRIQKLEIFSIEYGDRLNNIEASLDNKISWKHFIWIIGVVFMFMSVILSAIWIQTRENGVMGNDNHSAISRIEGILSNAEIVND